MSAVVIENVGAVGRVEIPDMPQGGICVFCGPNGAGKSTSISAIEALISGKKPNGITTKDGELFGKVEGWGAKLTIGDKMRRSGGIEVTSLESRVDPAALVNPGIKDPAVADEHRIKALVSLAGVKPDVSLFQDCFGKDLFDKTVKASSIQHDDLVAMAGALKRDAESGARQAESEADELAGRAKSKFEKPEDLDEKAACDERKLSDAYEKAIQDAAAIEATKEANDRIREDADAAMQQLEDIGEAFPLDDLDEEVALCENTVDCCERQFREAEKALAAAKSELKNSKTTRATVEQTSKQRQTLIDLIEKAKSVRVIDQPELETAWAAKDEARTAVQKGQRVRDYLAAKADGERLSKQSIAARQRADKLRKAAAATQDVLSAAVQKAGIPELRVDNGRLVTRTKRGKTLFADLSEGERWRIAIDIAIRQVGRGGVFAINQVAWDSVDVFNRDEINLQVKSAGVTIITAETLQDRDSTGQIAARMYE